MADERDRWLDRAAADRLLRGEPAVLGAEHHSRARAERLRAALDVLAEPPPATGELPGEAAAVAAFRAARGSVPRGRALGAGVFASGDTVVELSPPAGGAGSRTRSPGPRRPAGSASPSRKARPVRFGLAAALASVAVGGLAAVAGAGLLDRDTAEDASHLPAVSVTTGFSPAASGGTYAKPVPQPGQTTPPGGGQSQGGTPGPGNSPGAQERTPAGPDGGGSTGADGAVTAQPSAGGSTGGTGSTGEKGGTDRFLLGGTAGAAEKETEIRTKAAALCRDFRAGRLDNDGREKLVRLANGLLRIPRYCQGVLDGPAGGTKDDAPASGRTPAAGSTAEPARPPADGSRVSGGGR
ncbi:hypothetical protein ACWGDE_06740 [Streptomyces sp. NPDC054956]